MPAFLEDMEPLLLLSRKIGNLPGMVIRQVTDSMSNVPCHGGEEEMEAMSCRDDTAAFRLKIVAIVAILTTGVIGVSIPLIGTKRRFVRTDSVFFTLFKAFAAGVILATGFVHMLSDGQSALSDPCLPKSPWSDFPFPGFVTMLAALATLVVDIIGTHFYERKHSMEVGAAVTCAKPSSSAMVVDEDVIGIAVEEPGVVIGPEDADQTHAHHATSHRHCHDYGGPHEGHVHRQPHSHDVCDSDGHLSNVRNVVISQVLELGILSHSVIIGLSLGVSHSLCTIRPLTWALSFHQFFEGFALGGCISQAQFHNLAATLMACFFALTTPAGIAAGAAFASLYDPNSPRALTIEGLLDCVSAGILIYMALVDLIASDFLSQNTSSSMRLQLASFVALFLGAGAMSLLALWA